MFASDCNSHISVVEKLRGGPSGSTISSVVFRTKRNRRRVDVAKKTGELKAAAQTHGPVFLKVLGLAVGFVGIAYGTNELWRWARTSPHFALAEVVVKGNARSTDLEVARLGGLVRGQNLFGLDPQAIERAIAAHPWVKSVQVRRRFPKTLNVDLVEHRAVAMLSLGELYLVNEDAEPFKRVTLGDTFDLPLITGVDREGISERNLEALTALKAAVALLEAYQSTPEVSGQPLSELKLHPEGVTGVTTLGQEIEFGDGELTGTLSRLARVRKELKARSLEADVIRLDNRTRPTWVAVQVSAKKP